MIFLHFQQMLKCIRDYSHFSKTEFLSEMHNINWEDCLRNDPDISNLFDIYYSKISQIVDKHIPLKLLSTREMKFSLSLVYITAALKVSISIKNKLYQKYLKTKSCYDHSKFKYYRNKLNHLLKNLPKELL